jgi:UPF0755 protein
MTLAMRRALYVFLVTTAAGVGVVAFLIYKFVTYPDTVGGWAKGPVDVEVPKGAGAQQVSELLAGKGLLSKPSIFRLYAGQRGVASRFRAGHYRIDAPTTPRQLLTTMIRGTADELVAVTIPPGKNIVEIADLFAAAGVTPRDEFLAQVVDPQFLRSLEIPFPSLEGYLYPDTYRLPRRTPAARAIVPLVRRHRQVYDELRTIYRSGLASLRDTLGFDDAKVVLMASIVEKETGRADERPKVAAVYLNRLIKPTFRPKILQADPTIIYGCTVAPLFMGKVSEACGQWKGNIQYIHLYDKENPYNTYTHEGIPPGPIASPGRAALAAVMKPDPGPYLYFVAKPDGTSYFSSTVAEHEAAVVRYQRGGQAMPKSRSAVR